MRQTETPLTASCTSLGSMCTYTSVISDGSCVIQCMDIRAATDSALALSRSHCLLLLGIIEFERRACEGVAEALLCPQLADRSRSPALLLRCFLLH